MTPTGPAESPADPRWNVDFSLALFNRSGKYQIGREIIDANRDLIDQIYYWRVPWARVPTGLPAKLIGRAEKLERDYRVARGDTRSSPRGGRARWLHLDPLTVCHRPPLPGDIVLCHDLGPLTHPELFPSGIRPAYDHAFRVLLQSGATAVSVSHDTQDRLVAMYGEIEHKCVIYPPVAPRLSTGIRRRPESATADRFFLTVGAIGARKNQAACIRAFAASGLAGQGYGYLLCGSREPGYEEVAAAAHATPGVRLLSFVDDEELRWLYENAAGFVLASRLEGFGMPVAEAMAHGLVPIISRGSVLQEVAGDAAIPVSPDAESEIAASLNMVVQMSASERASRREQLSRRLTSFSPEIFQAAWRSLLKDRPA